MEHIVYLVALQNPNDLKKVGEHANKLATALQKQNSDAVNFAALVTASWKNDYGDLLCIGDNRKDTVLYYPIKEFRRHLNGFSYLPINSEKNDSIFSAFEAFRAHEMRDGNVNTSESYKVIIMDFRKKSAVFVGNEADVLVQSMDYSFGHRSTLHLICREENRSAYRRLLELLPEGSSPSIGAIGRYGSRSPFSPRAVAAIIN